MARTSGPPVQRSGTLRARLLGLPSDVREQSVSLLNPLLQDTIMLRELYKKHHWQVSGPTFYQLHLLFDKHYAEQNRLVDELAERIQTLGGVAVSMPHDVAQLTRIARPPADAESPPAQIERLLRAHEQILEAARDAAEQAAEAGDDGTNDLLVSSVVRTNELQVWFVSEHLVDAPLYASERDEAEARSMEPIEAAPSPS